MTREFLLDLIESSLSHAEEREGCPAMAVLDALDAAGALRDEEFARQMELADEIMHDDREALRALAK